MEDQGIGISAHTCLIYLINFTGSPQAPQKQKGMGFGLFIADEINEAHGRRLRAENEPDQGAFFHIALPIQNR